MAKKLTVCELKKSLENVPDDLLVELSSDSGVDQGDGKIIIEDAYRVTVKSEEKTTEDYFVIYANEIDECEEE